jgi:hypothetical protein
MGHLYCLTIHEYMHIRSSKATSRNRQYLGLTSFRRPSPSISQVAAILYFYGSFFSVKQATGKGGIS